MATIGSVQLIKNDGSETFDFKAETVEYKADNGLIVDSVISALREVVGGKLVLNNENIVVSGIIKDMDSDQYPNSGTYADDDLGFESELRRAHKNYGWTSGDGFDQLSWGTRSDFNVVFTNIQITEDATDEELGAGSYSFEAEFVYLDAFIS